MPVSIAPPEAVAGRAVPRRESDPDDPDEDAEPLLKRMLAAGVSRWHPTRWRRWIAIMSAIGAKADMAIALRHL